MRKGFGVTLGVLLAFALVGLFVVGGCTLLVAGMTAASG